MTRYRNCADRALGSKRCLLRCTWGIEYLVANEDAQVVTALLVITKTFY